jgi:g-D-glutamyl-meso-diaminopimelate peptidase
MNKRIIGLLSVILTVTLNFGNSCALGKGQTVTNSVYQSNNNAQPKLPTQISVNKDVYTVYNKNVVSVRQDYTYNIMSSEIEKLRRGYPQLKVTSIGNSVLGKKLYCLSLGTGPNKVIYTGTHHARENITTVLLMKYAELLCKKSNKLKVKGMDNKLWHGYDINKVLKDTTIYIVPMVNPDGVDLVYKGVDKTNPNYKALSEMHKGTNGYRDWKANARGIDLNRNYDWGFKKMDKSVPSFQDAKGPYAESEPEVKAVANFIRKVKPSTVYNYHAMGGVIYSSGLKYQPVKKFGKILSSVSGYSAINPPCSLGGCTDWIEGIWKGSILAYTIEVGQGKVPVDISQFNGIWNKNYPILTLGMVYKTPLYKSK